jgi:hypothetical protein
LRESTVDSPVGPVGRSKRVFGHIAVEATPRSCGFIIPVVDYLLDYVVFVRQLVRRRAWKKTKKFRKVWIFFKNSGFIIRFRENGKE